MSADTDAVSAGEESTAAVPPVVGSDGAVVATGDGPEVRAVPADGSGASGGSGGSTASGSGDVDASVSAAGVSGVVTAGAWPPSSGDPLF